MKMQLDHQFSSKKISDPQIILMAIVFHCQNEIRNPKLKPEDSESTTIEKSTTHSGTNGPNETVIGD
jgi:hypothetical protein